MTRPKRRRKRAPREAHVPPELEPVVEVLAQLLADDFLRHAREAQSRPRRKKKRAA
jgi:hypothetical protein